MRRRRRLAFSKKPIFFDSAFFPHSRLFRNLQACIAMRCDVLKANAMPKNEIKNSPSGAAVARLSEDADERPLVLRRRRRRRRRRRWRRPRRDVAHAGHCGRNDEQRRYSGCSDAELVEARHGIKNKEAAGSERSGLKSLNVLFFVWFFAH